MKKSRINALRGHVPPSAGRQPLFVRLCEAFVDNLSMILRGLFLLGAMALVQDLRLFSDDIAKPAEDSSSAVVAVKEQGGDASAETPNEEPVVTDRVKDALACTYKAYRDSHYDECVDDGGSLVYERPVPDGSRLLIAEKPVQLAALSRPDAGHDIR